jgi:hypothetical protein
LNRNPFKRIIRKMLGIFGGSLLVIAVLGAAICYKFVETPTIPQKKKVRVPDFDVGLNSQASSALSVLSVLSFRVARPTVVPV